MKVSIIGSGYTGSLLGKGLSKAGNNVVFYDVDRVVIDRLSSEGYNATLDITKAVIETEISFICVPTPTKNSKIDLSYVEAAVKAVGNELKNKNEYHLIAIKSTVVPTTTESIIMPILEATSGKKCGEGFGLCSNPEFLTQVHKTTKDPELKKWYESNPDGIKSFEDKVVIGAYDKQAGDILENLFKPLNTPIFKTNMKTAEMIKYANNIALTNKISYWNDIFLICNQLGIDSKTVAEIVSNDTRVGKYGIIHGKAFGGECLPKDLDAFLSFLKEKGITPMHIKAISELNEYMHENYGVRE